MSSETPSTSLETQLWSDAWRARMRAAVDRFRHERAETGFAVIRDYLEPHDPEFSDLLLNELIKVDLEIAWRTPDTEKLIEDYLEDYPQLRRDDAPPLDLIYEEHRIRTQADRGTTIAEYQRRFPSQASALGRLLAVPPAETIATNLVGAESRDWKAGERLEDFEILAKLGEGSFAAVYLARQLSLGRPVALKVSRDQGSESQTLAKLDHPCIVRVYDQRAVPERGLHLLYMQYVPGNTLEAVVDRVREVPPEKRNGRLLLEVVDASLEKRGESPPYESATRQRFERMTWPQCVCWIGARLAAALEYAHGLGVLHRDLKPANVLLTAEGMPKLADFNVSFCSKVAGVTPATFFGGSLAYMSLEQLEACDPLSERMPEDLDARSDVYALAILLWELLTAGRPFPDAVSKGGWTTMLPEIIGARRRGVSRETVQKLPPNLPSGMADVLLQCLSADRDKRPLNAAFVGRLLELCLRPRAQQILQPSGKNMASRFRAGPLFWFVFLALLPNIGLSAFNVEFNVKTVTQQFLPWHDFVWNMMVPVNALMYPPGITAGILLAWPVARAVSRRVGGGVAEANAKVPERLRTRCVGLGQWMAVITFLLWTLSGIVLSWLLKNAPLIEGAVFSGTEELHLCLSQTLFGLLTATQVYFNIEFLAVRGLYPVLADQGHVPLAELARLNRIETISGIVLAAAIATPFIAIGLLVQQTVTADFAAHGRIFGLIAILGFLGSIWAYIMQRIIAADIRTLNESLGPGEMQNTWTQ